MKKAKYIIGLCTMGNSSACLFRDKELVFAIEEERITRVKNESSFPFNSISACLEYEKININDIDEVCIYWRPKKVMTRIWKSIQIIIMNFFSIGVILKHIYNFFINNNKKKNGSWIDLFFIKKILYKKYGYKGKISFYNHHLCHALSAYIVSDKSETLCVSFDGGGEDESTVIYKISNQNIVKLNSVKWPNSLGHFYSFFTGFLGFRMLEGEYKMMGLAPYGKPSYVKELSKVVELLPGEKLYKFNFNFASYHLALYGIFSQKIKKIFGKNRNQSEEFLEKHNDIACSVQRKFEDIFDHILFYYNKKFNFENLNLLITGGCALNVTNNGRILEKKIFRKIFVPPAPHDAGAALGACVANLITKKKIELNEINFDNPYLGNKYENIDVKKLLDKNHNNIEYAYEEFDQLYKIVSKKLSEKKIIAWFQDRSEFGPRALGNRSYLADPRDDKIKDIINEKIKKRELFRPFAPSCLEEDKDIFFEINQSSPYMNFTCKVKKNMQSKIPAVVHVDNSVRLHTVKKIDNPKYWNLINEFKKLTGIGVLLNTSFNIQEPIVESPEDALNCFLRSSVDFLVINNFLISKK